MEFENFLMATFQTQTFKKKNRENATVCIENSKNYFNFTRKKNIFSNTNFLKKSPLKRSVLF